MRFHRRSCRVGLVLSSRSANGSEKHPCLLVTIREAPGVVPNVARVDEVSRDKDYSAAWSFEPRGSP